MSSRVILTLLFTLAACQTATPPPAQTPPPLPKREAMGVKVEARVFDAAGQPVAPARITVRTMDIECARVANTASSDDGDFNGFVEFGVGPQTPGCVTIDAFAAGSRATMTHRVIFGSEEDPENLVGGELILPRVELTETLALEIVERFRETLRQTDPAVEGELATYVGQPLDELRPRLNEIRRHLRTIERIEPRGGFTYRLHGVAGRTLDVRVIPGALPRLAF